MTQIAYLGIHAFPAERPGLGFHPCGYGALGFARPAAIGAAPQELMSAVELDLTLPILVWNNAAPQTDPR